MAEKYQHILIAPDSFTASKSKGWEVPRRWEAPNQDVLHAQVRAALLQG